MRLDRHVDNSEILGQEVIVTTLSEMLNFPIDMTTIIIVGNSTTFTSGSFMVTRRGYKL